MKDFFAFGLVPTIVTFNVCFRPLTSSFVIQVDWFAETLVVQGNLHDAIIPRAGEHEIDVDGAGKWRQIER